MNSSTFSSCETPIPQAQSASNGIPLSWVHPDLRRQIYDQMAQQNERGITRIMEREELLHHQCLQLVRDKLECEGKRNQLLEQLKHLDESIAEIDADWKTSSAIVEDVRVQRSLQQNQLKEKQFIDVTSSDLLDTNTLYSRAEASKAIMFSYSPNAALEIHFLHLFINPGLWNAFSSSTFRHNSGQRQHPYSASPCSKRESHEIGQAFLRQFFPVLEWNMDSSSNATEPVTGPSFFEQPCQMEITSLFGTEDELTFSTSNTTTTTTNNNNNNNNNNIKDDSHQNSKGSTGCTNIGCLFWHKDQLEHMKRVYGKTIRDICMHFCARDRRICAVSHFFMEAYERLCSSATVSDFCTGLVFTVSEIIRLGWHVLLVDGRSSGTSMDSGRASSKSTPRVPRPWLTPIAVDKTCEGSIAPTKTSTSRAWPHERLRNDSEKRFWRLVMERHEITLREEEVASLKVKNSLKTVSLQIFRECPTALSWRGVIRCVAENFPQQRWLAHRGFKLFPSSPHLALLYVLSLSQDVDLDPTKSSWEPETVVTVCMDVVSTLTAQCAGCLYMKDPEVSVGYPSLTARYIAYMIAVTAIRVANREHVRFQMEGDTENHALRLLTAAAEPGRYFLLPIALQNMVLLLTALQQHQHLNGLDVLPLGAISDQVMMVTNAPPSPISRPNEQRSAHASGASASAALNQQLQSLNRSKSDTVNPRIVEELKSSAQLSLLRLFHVRLEVMEQLLIKPSTAPGSVSQTALWMEYLYMIERQDGPGFSRQMSAQILESLSTTQTKRRSLVLLLLLYWRLQAQWSATCAETEWLAGMLSKIVSSLPEDQQLWDGTDEEETQNGHELQKSMHDARLDDHVALATSDVERAAFVILKSYEKMEDPQEQLEYLQQRLSDKRFCHDANSIILLLIALLQLCSQAIRKDWFESSLQLAVMVLHEQHLMWWSPLDVLFEGVVGTSHYVLLIVYQLIPLLLGPHGGEGATKEWRQCVLEVGARCGALHPLLRDTT